MTSCIRPAPRTDACAHGARGLRAVGLRAVGLSAVGRVAIGRRRRGQSGVSLVEVLVGIAVMMPLTLASVSGLLLAVETSSSTEVRQELEVTLSSATEDLKSVPYVECGSAEDYQELYRAWSEPLAVELLAGQTRAEPAVTDVQYWNRGKDAYTDSCGGDDGAQRLVVSVIDRGVTVTGSVVKRDAAARVGNSG